MRSHLFKMSLDQLKVEHQRMVEAIERLKDTQDDTGLLQLHSARALKFALECRMRNMGPGPAPEATNVISLSDYRAKLEARNHG